MNTALLILLIAAVAIKALSDFSPERNREAFRQTLPVDAVAHLQARNLPGQLFNSYNWGGYVLWELRQYPVFIDGRTDLYNDEIVDEWLAIVNAEPGWQAALDRRGVRLILLEPQHPLITQLKAQGWVEEYRDPLAVIYRR